MKKILFFIFPLVILVFSCKKKASEAVDNIPLTVTDADGNVYATIKVGNQIWMKENLKTTKFNDGTPITKYSFAVYGNNWHNQNSPNTFYQWADTNDLNNVHPNPLPYNYYGAMYNHYTLQTGKLAPVGWRIPTEQDFLTLKKYLSDNGYAGKEALALKSSSGWILSSGNGIDAIGFKGLPNGYTNVLGGPTFAEGICTWATSNFNAANKTRKLVQLYNKDTIMILDNAFQIGAGVRCIKE